MPLTLSAECEPLESSFLQKNKTHITGKVDWRERGRRGKLEKQKKVKKVANKIKVVVMAPSCRHLGRAKLRGAGLAGVV